MSKGTDPQMFESGYERNRLDRYWTNPWMTQALVRELARRPLRNSRRHLGVRSREGGYVEGTEGVRAHCLL